MHRWWQTIYARLVWLPTLVWNFLLGRVLHVRNWSDRVDPHVIVGAYPFARDVEGLHAEGVRAVVNTCEEYGGPVARYKAKGIEQLWIPTTDFTHPKLEDVEKAVEFIEHHVQRGDTVYVHCKAGRARSATVVMCWMLKYRGMTPDQAQQTLLQHRPHVNPRLTERPVVKMFCHNLAATSPVEGEK